MYLIMIIQSIGFMQALKELIIWVLLIPYVFVKFYAVVLDGVGEIIEAIGERLWAIGKRRKNGSRKI